MSRVYPGYGQDGQTSQRLVGVNYLDTTDLGTPIAVGIGATVTRGPFLVAGFNSFMFFWNLTTASTIRLEYAHLDPAAPATVVFTRIVRIQVNAAASLDTWGAFATVGPSDSFIYMQIRFVHTAGVAATIDAAALWMSAR